MTAHRDDRRDDRQYGRRLRARLQAAGPVLVGLGAVLALLAVAGQVSLNGAAFALLAAVGLAMVFGPDAPDTQTASGPAPVGEATKQPAAPSTMADSGDQRLLDTMPDPVLVIRPDGVILHANAASTMSLGRVAAGASAFIRFRNPELQDRLRECLFLQKPARVEYVERGPVERWFEVSLVPFAMSDTLSGCILHFRDLTETRRLDRMRRDFIANASHELRTPLASLKGFLETLSGHARHDEEARDRFLAIMSEQAQRMERLIDDLLSLSRFETAMGRADFGLTDLADVLFHVRSALAPAAEARDVTLDLDDEALLELDGQVNGSRDELIQLFENLVENAIKYGGEGAQVAITIQSLQKRRAVMITVSDTGPGIAPEHIPRLTERFYRVDVATSRARQGTGLGLAIVKHIVTRHEGTLSIQSRLGEGSRFTVTLPLILNKASAQMENKEKSVA